MQREPYDEGRLKQQGNIRDGGSSNEYNQKKKRVKNPHGQDVIVKKFMGCSEIASKMKVKLKKEVKGKSSKSEKKEKGSFFEKRPGRRRAHNGADAHRN